MNTLHFIFGIFGNVTALFLFLAPVITFWKIIKKKSTEQFSGIPYVSTLLNCLLSAWYGLPFISPNNMLVSTINGTGAIIEIFYVILFLVYADKKNKAKIFGILVMVLAVFTMVTLVSMLALHGHTRKIFCGFAAAIFSICMYASPLSVMDGDKDKERKVHAVLPIIVRVSVRDIVVHIWPVGEGSIRGGGGVQVPNGFGCGLGAMQLIMYAIYKDWKGTKASAAPQGKDVDGSMEMGNAHSNGKP
eukprot:Gb_30076 [translate_table: standard]